MKITVDTKEDSKEEIKKIVEILSKFLDSGEAVISNMAPTSEIYPKEALPTTNVADIFNNMNSPKQKEIKESDKDEKIEIIPY